MHILEQLIQLEDLLSLRKLQSLLELAMEPVR
ncbi:Uncharacterised protein [Mycobacterium tuberculosis]|nr:Uncharacterised protein [Mycobacterium tuberculosis]